MDKPVERSYKKYKTADIRFDNTIEKFLRIIQADKKRNECNPGENPHICPREGKDQQQRRAKREKPISGSGTNTEGDVYCPWHFLYFLPLPQGQGSLRPTFGP